MTQGPVAVSEVRRVAQRAFEILPCAREGIPIVQAERQIGRNGRGQRAAGAVGIARLESWSPQLEAFVGGIRDIDRLRAVQVSAFDEYDAGTQLEDPPAGGPHVLN